MFQEIIPEDQMNHTTGVTPKTRVTSFFASAPDQIFCFLVDTVTPFSI